MTFIKVYDAKSAKLLLSKGFKLISKQTPSISFYIFEYNKELANKFSKEDLSSLKGKVEFSDSFNMYF